MRRRLGGIGRIELAGPLRRRMQVAQQHASFHRDGSVLTSSAPAFRVDSSHPPSGTPPPVTPVPAPPIVTGIRPPKPRADLQPHPPRSPA